MDPSFEFADPFQTWRNLPGPNRQLFFGGECGAGRTFLAALSAIYLADCGYRTLLAAVRPPAGLGRALGAGSSAEPQNVEDVANLWTLTPDLAGAQTGDDLAVLARLAALSDEQEFDFIMVNRVPGHALVSRIAAACQRGESLAAAPRGSRSPVAAPSERQWRLYLARLWNRQASRSVAVARWPVTEPERFAASLATMRASGITPGLIVANGLPEHGPDRETDQASLSAFLQEVFAAAAHCHCAVADMPQAQAGGGSLDALRHSALAFFRLGSRLRSEQGR